MAVRGAQFRRDGEPALVSIHVFRRHRQGHQAIVGIGKSSLLEAANYYGRIVIVAGNSLTRTSRLGLSNRLAATVLSENGAKGSSLNLYELIRDRPQLRQRVLTE